MSNNHSPKNGDVVKEIGTIKSVFNGYVEVKGFNPALAFIRIPIHQLKWNNDANLWEVS